MEQAHTVVIFKRNVSKELFTLFLESGALCSCVTLLWFPWGAMILKVNSDFRDLSKQRAGWETLKCVSCGAVRRRDSARQEADEFRLAPVLKRRRTQGYQKSWTLTIYVNSKKKKKTADKYGSISDHMTNSTDINSDPVCVLHAIWKSEVVLFVRKLAIKT